MRSSSPCAPAGSAGRTSTSRLGSSRRAGTGSFPATRWSAPSWREGPARRGSTSASASGSPGCGRRTGRAISAGAARRTSAASSQFTGWDADGGYAEFAVVDAAFAYAIPEGLPDAEAAPLLCAGIIGFRALRRAALPPGGRLGIYGFGASAHLAAQVARYEGATVHVMTRSADARRLALALGAASAQGASDPPPEPLDAAILFAPVGELVPVALRALERGGTLAVAGIYLSEIPPVDYESELFYEKNLRSVTANTRADGEEFLRIAAAAALRVVTTPYPFVRADEALRDLARDRVEGAAVLVVEGG